ncbi:MAG: hypothetical protein CYPHOPRED_001775 [Cyphobasidiales sp. Tagirdzhanova-0007]|nr:MAG: hypothetical protein CYPHOPRED_001775 [Cyphobasidiales sp. Tagirdzhanova-0007]
MKSFVYESLPARVIFGSGTSKNRVAEELRKLGCSRAIIITGPRGKSVGEDVKAAIPRELIVGSYSKAAMHTPEKITLDAIKYAEEVKADCAIAIGGGSAIGLAKSLALHSQGRIKQIAIPTTYAGSETTQVVGQTKDGRKTTTKSPLILPQVIIYDVDLTLSLSSSLTVSSAMNALAHAVEALYSQDINPIIELVAIQGIQSLKKALPLLTKDPQDVDARSDALYGAWACGTCLGAIASMGLHHKLCHTLGGTFNMPHSETHTVILPHAAAYNAPYATDAMSKVASALGSSSAPQALYDLARNNGGPYSLKSLGFKEEDLEKAAEVAAMSPYPNPAPLEKQKLLLLLQNAWEGKRPE